MSTPLDTNILLGIQRRDPSFFKRSAAALEAAASEGALAAKCPACGNPVGWPQHLTPDFLIGAYAELHTGSLLIRDRSIYGPFFSGLAREV